ncbi:MAG: DEAD/DEAH box helicase [Actinomycetota bacterium]
MSRRATVRITFGFPLDPFQQRAMDALDQGRNVLVSAPTGSGKTVVAHHAVNLALDAGLRVAYTAPIKALSNQVHRDLAAALGPESVGLLTGDRSIRPDAPVVVMTTEVLRNMVYAHSPWLEGLGWFVLDEVHFLQDAYRGQVWEEVLIHAPASTRAVCLSATVSNAPELGAWIESLRGPTDVVVSHHRPVDLDVLYMVEDRSAPEDHLIPVFVDGRPNDVGRLFDDDRSNARRGSGGRTRRRYRTPRRVEVVDRLAAEDLLPGITFIFSRAACDDAAHACLDAGVRLTNAGERRAIREIVETHTAELSDADLSVLGYDRWLAALEHGVASHHAGMVPAFREAVEACFVRGLVKMVFATETLALGINMPARSVVLERLTRYTGDHHEVLTPATFTQLTGRAGRRGLDDHGVAVILWSPFVDFEQVARLASSREYTLRSAFRPTYNMAANLVARYTRSEAEGVIGRSFAQFQIDRSAVQIRASIDAVVARLAASESTEVDLAVEYLELTEELRRERRRRRSPRHEVLDSLAQLVPGDVIERSGGRNPSPIVVLAVANRSGGAVRVRACTSSGTLVNLHQHNVRSPVVTLGRIELPTPYRPNDDAYRRNAGRRLASARLQPRRRRSRPPPEDSDAIAVLKQAVADHPVDRRSDRRELIDAANSRIADRNELERLERRLDRRGGGLVGRFVSMVGLLEDLGYVDDWDLTAAGERLRRTYHECDLLVCEAVERGLIDDLDVPSMAAVLSCFVYERRGGEVTPSNFPTSEVADRVNRILEVAGDLGELERAAGGPETRSLDSGFCDMAYRWAAGDHLASVLEEETTGGDFVRTVRMLVDLMRQLAVTAPEPVTRTTLRRTVDALERGVVDPTREDDDDPEDRVEPGDSGGVSRAESNG